MTPSFRSITGPSRLYFTVGVAFSKLPDLVSSFLGEKIGGQKVAIFDQTLHISNRITMHYLSLKRHSSITNVLMFCEPVACKTTAVSVTYSS